MKYTNKYNLAYFEQGDYSQAVPEMQRWITLDTQLKALFDIMGNGVITGWTILPSSGLSISISAGKAHVAWVAVETTENTILENLNPSTTNYIYAALTQTSYWDQSVSFVAFTSEVDLDEYLYIGEVTTNAVSVQTVNIDARVYLSFLALIQSMVKAHRHIGGTDNPDPINLASEVQGIINQNNLPDLDASIIQAGTIDNDRLPQIDHITNLINQGTLTHAQLDSFVSNLSVSNNNLMGETSTIDLLQLLLSLKHVYPDIDEYLVNEIAYIPGISDDSMVDWVNTTATVDVLPSSLGGQHTITGSPGPSKLTRTNTWDSESEFETGTHSNVLIDGNNVSLETEVNTKILDVFSNITDWTVTTTDLSSVSSAMTLVPPVATVSIAGQQVEIALTVKKEFDAEDWSDYNYITFYLNTTSVQHGDIYFYINDTYYGIQNSYTKVLDKNAPTINIDTLQNGWQEITVDISAYTRTNIMEMGFFISSQDGWDTSKGFEFDIENIYLSTGNIFKENGYLRLIFGNDFPYEFWRVRWDAIVPTDSQSVGVELKCRTRVGNTLLDLSTAAWSSYTSTSGSVIVLPAVALYKYIEIEMYFGASNTLDRSAYLRKVFLDYNVVDVENTFVYDSEGDWESGDLFNIDTTTYANSMAISRTEEVGDIFYGTNGSAVQLDENLVGLYRISGTALPTSTYQSLNELPPGFGTLTGVSRGSNGNIWVSDLQNDRVVEVDKSGALITAFYGSFLTPPSDYYGTEDSGPGSNEDIATPTTTTTTTTLAGETSTTTTVVLNSEIDVLSSIYNSETGVLYIVFDKELEDIYSDSTKLDMDKMYLKIGAQRFSLSDSTQELLGVSETAYNNWYPLYNSTSENAQFIKQFKFTSNVLKLTLNGADKALLNYMVNPGVPSIVIVSPDQDSIQTSTSVTVKFITYNFVLGSSLSGNRIRVTLDGTLVQDTYANSITFAGLSSSKHSIKAQLVDADGTLNTNIEAIAEGDFIVNTGTYTAPYVCFTSPKINQIYSSSPVLFEFEVKNFPILTNGQHLRYQLDSNGATDYYSEDPIKLEDISAGKHELKIYLVDKYGTDLGYVYGTSTVNFIVGLNSLARVKLYIDREAIYDVNGNITTNTIRKYVDVGNVMFENIYSPIDVQVIPNEMSTVNEDGLPTVLVAKLRSQSWLDGISDTAHVQEFTRRLALEASELATTTTTTTTLAAETTTTTTTLIYPYSATPTSELIYGTKYLDGHSVVQLNLSGNVIFSNNAAVFAQDKESAATLLGSAEKIGDNELLIGDSYNKRAIITYTDLSTQKPQIEWQMDSDRYIPDFHLILQDDVTISVTDDAISSSEVVIRQGTNIIWENNSSAPITILSGTTSYSEFQLDPDLNLYGDVFRSPVLQPGEVYSYKFVSAGEQDWFAYSSILPGKITITKTRLSSRDQFVVLESDGLESPFTSRLIKVDCYGNVLWALENYIVLPRDARPLISGGVIIST